MIDARLCSPTLRPLTELLPYVGLSTVIVGDPRVEEADSSPGQLLNSDAIKAALKGGQTAV